MFLHFFLAEIKYILKQPLIYIFTAIISLFVFYLITTDNLIVEGATDNVYRNAPHIITLYTSFLTIFGLLAATVFFDNAALRDYHNSFDEILFSAPIKKSAYFFGRFFGALVLATVPLLGVFAGILIGSFVGPTLGLIEADQFGDLYLSSFIRNYFFMILPNMFFVGTIIFSLANFGKSTVISFLGTLVIICSYIISGTLMTDIENQSVAALIDTFGIRTYSFISRYYTPMEKNLVGLQLTPIFIYNRLIWLGLGAIILMSSYLNFSFKLKHKKLKIDKDKRQEIRPIAPIERMKISFSNNTSWEQFKSFFFINFLNITKSASFKIMLILSLFILFANLAGAFEYLGLQSYPVTYKTLDIISGIARLFTLIIVIFYGGELIWRDKELGFKEVVDSTPHQSLITQGAKTLVLIVIASMFYICFVVGAIIYQALNDYYTVELELYISSFFINYLSYFTVYSAMIVLIHSAATNKNLGYLLSIALIFALDSVLQIANIETNMILPADSPTLIYSDMNGFGPAFLSTIWFNLYWFLFALICLFVSTMIWQKGIQTSVVDKIRLLKKPKSKYFKFVFYAVLLAWVTIFSFIFYNTQLLNNYDDLESLNEKAARYEKKYKQFQNVLLPKIVSAKYFVDIFPEKRDIEIRSNISFLNTGSKAIDSLHFSCNPDWNTSIEIEGAELIHFSSQFDYRIYKLKIPLEPGDSLEATIYTDYITKGFENEVTNTSIVRNGTFINNLEFLPRLGYQGSFEISEAETRRKFDLPLRERQPKLKENCTVNCNENLVTNSESDFIDVETVISTSQDQVAVASGTLISKWESGGRNFFHYKVDHPSLNFHSFVSAQFECKKTKWKDVDIEIYYDKKHSVNIDKMTKAVEKSLRYYTKHFGPYYHNQCRIIEFPRYSEFAQAFPGTMPYSEAFGFVINLEDESKNNVIDVVIAHEIAHQYWAHQVVGANVQGVTMLNESFAEYSSLMVRKNDIQDIGKMRELLKYTHDRYLIGRSKELKKEMPLYKVADQPYIHYGKGGIVLFALQEYIGEENVNAAMRGFLEEYKYKGAPYPTTLDFLEHLEPKVPDSMKYLINDWFKEITLYDLQIKHANYHKLGNGKYAVNLTVNSKKIKADSIGNERAIPIDDYIDIGLFADKQEEELIWKQRLKINKELSQIMIEVDTIPVKAAVDPYHLLIDRNFEDNIKIIEAVELN